MQLSAASRQLLAKQYSRPEPLVRDAPAPGPALGQRADALVMADNNRAVAAARPALAGGVGHGPEGGVVGARAGEHVVLVRLIATARGDIAALVNCPLHVDVVSVVQVVQIARDQLALGFVPGAGADAVARVDRGHTLRVGRRRKLPGRPRWARQVLLPARAAAASRRHSASAPSSPPRSTPLPLPVLLMKKPIGSLLGFEAQAASSKAPAVGDKARARRIGTSHRGVGGWKAYVPTRRFMLRGFPG
jgi:hypothetical protein